MFVADRTHPQEGAVELAFCFADGILQGRNKRPLFPHGNRLRQPAEQLHRFRIHAAWFVQEKATLLKIGEYMRGNIRIPRKNTLPNGSRSVDTLACPMDAIL